ncbi:MAG: hypothetical protein NXI04_28755 [Planctomycetaceae bacterium]|nr:hypothetical protein [Planctomycetaceae bacterium]
MSLEELLQQMEDFRSRKEKRDCRPDWLKRFVNSAATVFEPLAHSGRVGFDCQGDEHGWTVCMYLGTTEIIGGPRDGQIEHTSFMVDLKKLENIFTSIDRLEWYSIANETGERFDDATRSVLSVRGQAVEGESVHLELLHTPPRFVEPAFRNSKDGVDLF